MSMTIRSPKNFWTGVLYVGFGGAALWLARDYSMGQASRMGPGYFPMMLSALLMLFGMLAMWRGLRTPGQAFGAFAWKPVLRIVAAVAAFAWLLPRAGFVVALVVLILGSASASTRFSAEPKALALAGALVAFCVLVFVKGLGLPLPLVGEWFGG